MNQENDSAASTESSVFATAAPAPKPEPFRVNCEICGRDGDYFWGFAGRLVCRDCPDPSVTIEPGLTMADVPVDLAIESCFASGGIASLGRVAYVGERSSDDSFSSHQLSAATLLLPARARTTAARVAPVERSAPRQPKPERRIHYKFNSPGYTHHEALRRILRGAAFPLTPVDGGVGK